VFAYAFCFLSATPNACITVPTGLHVFVLALLALTACINSMAILAFIGLSRVAYFLPWMMSPIPKVIAAAQQVVFRK